MLEKILNSMLHGNAKTKIFLWSVFILGVSAVFLLMAGIIMGIPYLGLGGVLVGLVGLILSQSVSLNDLKREKKPKGKKAPKQKEEQEEKVIEDKQQKEKKEEEAAPKEKTRKEREREKSQYLSSLNAKNTCLEKLPRLRNGLVDCPYAHNATVNRRAV